MDDADTRHFNSRFELSIVQTHTIACARYETAYNPIIFHVENTKQPIISVLKVVKRDPLELFCMYTSGHSAFLRFIEKCVYGGFRKGLLFLHCEQLYDRSPVQLKIY
jgi:hypothetical protein